MEDEEIQQWVEANPGRVNDQDYNHVTPLYEVAVHRDNIELTAWLLDEKGAKLIPLIIFDSPSPEIFAVLVDRCVDPTVVNEDGDYFSWTILMHQIAFRPYANVEYLLDDPRFRATINDEASVGCLTALYAARLHLYNPGMFDLLLEAGADPIAYNGDYSTTLGNFS